ncbi:hypothetical protein CC80DRAFT_498582 [Byssothecium circinans]|uniref:Uncharacterized protein n=1 Tax=Byssothecium circinans TaxID=147558 RepID=A0A6A5UQN1_9PLEO|nr:hypothetical protein CC80DRAFT_498582 [Byssothecium circinans]
MPPHRNNCNDNIRRGRRWASCAVPIPPPPGHFDDSSDFDSGSEQEEVQQHAPSTPPHIKHLPISPNEDNRECDGLLRNVNPRRRDIQGRPVWTSCAVPVRPPPGYYSGDSDSDSDSERVVRNGSPISYADNMPTQGFPPDLFDPDNIIHSSVLAEQGNDYVAARTERTVPVYDALDHLFNTNRSARREFLAQTGGDFTLARRIAQEMLSDGDGATTTTGRIASLPVSPSRKATDALNKYSEAENQRYCRMQQEVMILRATVRELGAQRRIFKREASALKENLAAQGTQVLALLDPDRAGATAEENHDMDKEENEELDGEGGELNGVSEDEDEGSSEVDYNQEMRLLNMEAVWAREELEKVLQDLE